MFGYIAGTPFAYITYHHVPPQFYGLLFAAGTQFRSDAGHHSGLKPASVPN
jgi:hypothetical protein